MEDPYQIEFSRVPLFPLFHLIDRNGRVSQSFRQGFSCLTSVGPTRAVVCKADPR